MQAVVDTHQHVWDLERFDLPWLRGEPRLRPLARSFGVADYLADARGTGIERSLYMEIAVAPAQQAEEVRTVLALCARDDTPFAGAVLPGRPGTPGFRAHVESFAGNPFAKGVRQLLQVPDVPPGRCLEPAFVDDVRWLGERGLCFDLCLRPGEIGDGAALARACPATRFVLDHCGNVHMMPADEARWRRDVEEIGALPNVWCKVSGLTVPDGPIDAAAASLTPLVDDVLDCFGADRVLFAGNWPVCRLQGGLARWVETLRAIVARRPEDEQRRLFHDNAVAFYALPSAEPGTRTEEER